MNPFDTHFLHVDMDAFYVEVERREDASLVGVPVVVGGLGERGVVASASYEARGKGIRSAMPIGEARRRAPRARFVPPDMAKYATKSKAVFAILDEFSPYVEPLSIDEAFIDVAGLRRHFESPMAVGTAIRSRLRSELSLPASVGIAAVKFLAKMASKAAKPDGLVVIQRGAELDFLHPMAVEELWGVGQATLASLQGLGIETIGQLAGCPPRLLRRHVGSAVAEHLGALAAGADPRGVDTARDTKSVSVESTYGRDIHGDEPVERALLELCHRLSGRLRHSGLAGHTVTLKVRFGDFTTITRSATRDQLFADTTQLWPVVRSLVARAAIAGRGVRLLGVGVTGLAAGEPAQMVLDGSDRNALADVAAEVRDRFGDDAVRPARLAERPAEWREG